MYIHSTEKRVRYGETDRMGYLYYGHYPLFYEIGRVEAMRELGLSYRYMEDELGIMMPVMSLEARYLRPAFYDELIEIRTAVRKLPERDIVFHCELYKDGNTLINSGKVKLCFVGIESGTRKDCPPLMIDKFRTHFE